MVLPVSAIPYSFSTELTVSHPFLNTILKHLDKHRFVTTMIKIVITEFVKISVIIHITLKNQLADKERLKIEVYDILWFV